MNSDWQCQRSWLVAIFPNSIVQKIQQPISAEGIGHFMGKKKDHDL